MPTQDDKPFWDGLRSRRLVLPYCVGCARFWFPPAPRCPQCLGTAGWRECPDTGTLWSWTTVHRAFAPGFSVPYTVVQVELDAQPGLLIDSTLAGAVLAGTVLAGTVPAGWRGTPLRIGLPVTAVYLDDPRGFTVHAFKPAAGEAP